MKLLVCACVLLVSRGALGGHIPPELEEVINEIQATCEADTGVTAAIVEEAKKTMKIPSDDNFKCFIKCVMVHMQVLSDDGVFQEEMALQHIPQELKDAGADEVIHKCKNEKGSDPCDTAYQLAQCFAKASQVMGEVFT